MKPGDIISITTDDATYTGTLMPNEETDSIIIKLENGYNVGIRPDRIKKKSVMKPYAAPSKEPPKRVKKEGKRPLITILHTGGTIASKVDYKTGGVIARFSPEELVSLFPELGEIATIDSWLVSNMFSEDMRFAHYTLIAEHVHKAWKNGSCGVIISHGTDTMAYSSAALSFIIQRSPIPIILVGAQRSSDRGSSDAGANLICAARFIVQSDFAGVAICMHESIDDDTCLILPGTKTRKMHSSRRDAFCAINAKPIARIGYLKPFVTLLTDGYAKAHTGAMEIRPKMEERVGLLKVHPNLFPEQIAVFTGWKGLVIEGTGLGQMPTGVPNELCSMNAKNMEAIRKLVSSGTIVVMTTQAIYGRVQMHVYSAAIDLVKAGVIPGEDMLPETALVKLSWLLANQRDNAKELIRTDIAGEINGRLTL